MERAQHVELELVPVDTVGDAVEIPELAEGCCCCTAAPVPFNPVT